MRHLIIARVLAGEGFKTVETRDNGIDDLFKQKIAVKLDN